METWEGEVKEQSGGFAGIVLLKLENYRILQLKT